MGQGQFERLRQTRNRWLGVISGRWPEASGQHHVLSTQYLAFQPHVRRFLGTPIQDHSPTYRVYVFPYVEAPP